MDVLMIVVLEFGISDGGKKPYGFAPHVWETGGRESAGMEMEI